MPAVCLQPASSLPPVCLQSASSLVAAETLKLFACVCLRLLAFACVCLRLLAFACVCVHRFVCVLACVQTSVSLMSVQAYTCDRVQVPSSFACCIQMSRRTSLVIHVSNMNRYSSIRLRAWRTIASFSQPSTTCLTIFVKVKIESLAHTQQQQRRHYELGLSTGVRCLGMKQKKLGACILLVSRFPLTLLLHATYLNLPEFHPNNVLKPKSCSHRCCCLCLC